ncbi:reverse transcriptase domain-containing protein [Tanacetum coccineum]
MQSQPQQPIQASDPKEKGKGILIEEPKKKKLSLQQVRALETTNDKEVARKVQAEWDAEEERKRLEDLKKPTPKPKTISKKSTSLAQERNQMMSFLKGQGYKNVQKLRKGKADVIGERCKETLKEEKSYNFEKSAQDRESLEAISMFHEFKTDLHHYIWRSTRLFISIFTNGLGLILRGDLHLLSDVYNNADEFWGESECWEIVRWRLNESSGVHTLELEDGTMIHMLTERRYPLSRELMIRMLDHGFEEYNLIIGRYSEKQKAFGKEKLQDPDSFNSLAQKLYGRSTHQCFITESWLVLIKRLQFTMDYLPFRSAKERTSPRVNGYWSLRPDCIRDPAQPTYKKLSQASGIQVREDCLGNQSESQSTASRFKDLLICMRTRNSNFPNNSNVTIPRRQNRGRAPNVVEPELRTIVEVAPMAERTMEELLRAPTEGYEEAIVLPEINADHFEIKTNLLQLVQANPFHDVPNDVIKLMIFPYSLEGAAKVWYEKEPPNSILTWEDLITKFVNQFFPPSKTTNLKNEISHFTQKFEETFSEAWERFKEMLRACPHHGFTELTQVDIFYNGLNKNDQDSLNAAAGGNLLSKTTREALNIIENKSKVRYSLEIVSKKVITPAPVKAVEEIYVTCSGPHAWYNCPNTDTNQASVCAATGSYNQVNPQNRVSNQIAPPGFAPVQNNGQNRYNQNQGQGNNFNRGNNFHGNQGFQAQNNHAPNFQNQGFQNQPFQVPNNQVQQEFSNEFSSYKRTNDQMMRNMQNQINSLKGEVKNEIQNTMKTQQAVLMNQQNVFQTNLQNMLSGFFQNQASTLSTLPSNTIPNPKCEMKAITTRSGVVYEGPSIPTNPSPKKVVERETEETTDKEQTNFQGSIAHIPPPVNPIPILEPDIPKTLSKPNILYPSRYALLLMPRFAPTIKSLLMNKEKLLELAKIPLNENCSAMLLRKLPENPGDPDKFLILCNFSGIDICHALPDLGASINLMPLSIWKKLSLPELTPTRMTLELADRSITHPKGLAEDVYVKVGKFHFPTDFIVVDFEADPRVPLILGRSFLRTGHALIDVYGEEITLRVDIEAITFNLDQTTRYSSTNDKSVNRIDIIDEVCEEYASELPGFSNKSSGGNPTPTSEPLTSEFILEEIEAYLKDDSISPEIDHADCDPEGDICLIEKLLNNDPFQLPPMDLKQGEIIKAKSSMEEPPELELKDLPSHLEYAYLEENDKLPVIIAKGLKDDEKEALLKVLKSHKRAIAWKITDIKGIDPRFCTHKILMEDDYKPTVQSQRRVNPKIHEVIKKEVLKLLDAGMIYPISDSPWVSPVHCVPKKGGITVVANEENELIPTRLVTGWRVCIDYRKLNEATRKDHFPLPVPRILV